MLATLEGVTLLTEALPPLATSTLPNVSTARYPGPTKRGDAPSTEAPVAVPAQVDTVHRVGASGAGHAAQADAPTAADCPGGQGTHAAAPAPAAVPAGQGSARAAGSQPSVPGQKEPGGHGAQARLASMKEPGAQATKGEGV